MNASVTTMSSTPCRRSRSITCSMQGLPTMGTIGLGWFEVSGRRRVPSPPAITTAFIAVSRRAFTRYCAAAATASADADPEEHERPGRALVGAGHDDEARVEHPGRELAEEVDLELVPAAAHERIAEDERTVANEDHGERDPRQAAVPPEQDRRPCRSSAGRRAGRRTCRTATPRASAARASRRSGQ